MNNVMIDIETLALSNDAAVIAVGACAFDANDVGGKFEVLLNPVLSPGRRDEETLEWWRRQPAEVLERMTGGLATPREACEGLAAFVLSQGPPAKIWANSPSFDCVVLRTLFGVVGASVPWSFRDELDYRTLRAMYRSHPSYDDAAIESIRADRTAHDALSDAVCQARTVQLIYRDMGVRL